MADNTVTDEVVHNRLRDLAYEASSKWSRGYVRWLGALEHMDEVLTLHRHHATVKAELGHDSRVAQDVACAIEREMADLWVLLEMDRMADPAFGECCEKRANRFQP